MEISELTKRRTCSAQRTSHRSTPKKYESSYLSEGSVIQRIGWDSIHILKS